MNGLTLETVSKASCEFGPQLKRSALLDYLDRVRVPNKQVAVRIGRTLARLGAQTDVFEALWHAGYHRDCVAIVGAFAGSRPKEERPALWSATIFHVLTWGEFPGTPQDLLEALSICPPGDRQSVRKGTSLKKQTLEEFENGDAHNIPPRWRVLLDLSVQTAAERWALV
jgi:hypothetical protein